jgi:hypothetical protein
VGLDGGVPRGVGRNVTRVVSNVFDMEVIKGVEGGFV